MKNKDFENNLNRLKEISIKIDSDDLDFSNSLELFEEGMLLSIKCRKFLNKAELKIEKIILKNDEIELEDFNLDNKK
jgi:exodeoxyribonuclease VII small subunit